MSNIVFVLFLLALGTILGFVIGYNVGYNTGLKPECDKLGGEIIKSRCVEVLIF